MPHSAHSHSAHSSHGSSPYIVVKCNCHLITLRFRPHGGTAICRESRSSSHRVVDRESETPHRRSQLSHGPQGHASIIAGLNRMSPSPLVLPRCRKTEKQETGTDGRLHRLQEVHWLCVSSPEGDGLGEAS